MKPILLLATALLLASCSVKNTLPTAAEMRGQVRYSFEQAEFRHNGKTYFVSDKNGAVAGKINALRGEKQAYEAAAEMCLVARVLTKTQNGGRGFGHAERYAQAVEVEKLC